MSVSTILNDLSDSAQEKTLSAIETSQSFALGSLKVVSSTSRRVVAKVPLLSSVAELTPPAYVQARVDSNFEFSKKFMKNQRQFTNQVFAALTES